MSPVVSSEQQPPLPGDTQSTSEAFRASEARLKAGADLAGLGCYEVDFQGQLLFADERLGRILGISAGYHADLEVLKRWAEHLHPEDRQRVLEAREELQDGRCEHVSIEYRYLHPTEGVRWIHHAALVSARNASGRAVRSYGAMRDISEFKRSEEAARDLSRRLLRAQEEERARLAKELHDGLSQNLALLSVELEMLGQRLPEAPAEINARLKEFSGKTKGLSAEVHRISHGLHPAKLTQLGLVVALRGHCREVETAHGIAVRFEARDVPRELPEELALCLYRVAQEAIQNVVKHSGARHADVKLSVSGEAIEMSIADDGSGFVVAAQREVGSLGLVSMRERAQVVQGEVSVESAPSQGTRVCVRAPLAGGKQP